MYVQPPTSLMLFCEGNLTGLFTDPRVFPKMQMAAQMLYSAYIVSVNKVSISEFNSKSADFLEQLKGAYIQCIKELGYQQLIAVVDRTVLQAYFSADHTLCVHFDVLPKNVNLVYSTIIHQTH